MSFRDDYGDKAENGKLLGDIILVSAFVGSMITILWAVLL